ncbi:hypothetical protein M2271_002156 [Streptomyces sp. LBL]|nr:hypothetical protein [Streptomyces sp. LBL]
MLLAQDPAARRGQLTDQLARLGRPALGVQDQGEVGEVGAGAQGVGVCGALVLLPCGDHRPGLRLRLLPPAQGVQGLAQEVVDGPDVAVPGAERGVDVARGLADERLGLGGLGVQEDPGQGEAGAEGALVLGAQQPGGALGGVTGQGERLAPASLFAQVVGEPGERGEGGRVVRANETFLPAKRAAQMDLTGLVVGEVVQRERVGRAQCESVRVFGLPDGERAVQQLGVQVGGGGEVPSQKACSACGMPSSRVGVVMS